MWWWRRTGCPGWCPVLWILADIYRGAEPVWSLCWSLLWCYVPSALWGDTVISYLVFFGNELLAVVFASQPQASLFLWYSQNLCCHSEELGDSGSPGSKHGMPWSLAQVPVSAGLLLSFPLHDFFISLKSGLRWGTWCGSMKKGSWSDLFVSPVFHSFSHYHSA